MSRDLLNRRSQTGPRATPSIALIPGRSARAYCDAAILGDVVIDKAASVEDAQNSDQDAEAKEEARHEMVVARWRLAFEKVTDLARLGMGGEPGAFMEIDVRDGRDLPPNVEHKLNHDFPGRVEVQLLDYCLTSVRPRLTRWQSPVGGASPEGLTTLRAFLNLPRPILRLEPQTRWIKVEGFAWILAKALASRYHLPPLLVSDLLAVENTEVLRDFVREHRWRTLRGWEGSRHGGAANSGGGGGSCKDPPVPPPDPHRRIKNEYYISEGILYCSMSMIGLRTRLLIQPTQQAVWEGADDDSTSTSPNPATAVAEATEGDQAAAAATSAAAVAAAAAAAAAAARNGHGAPSLLPQPRSQSAAVGGGAGGSTGLRPPPLLSAPARTVGGGGGQVPPRVSDTGYPYATSQGRMRSPRELLLQRARRSAGSANEGSSVDGGGRVGPRAGVGSSGWLQWLASWRPLLRLRKARELQQYHYEKRWVEEPVCFLLLQDKPRPDSRESRGATVISIFHTSGRSVTYRLWQQLAAGPKHGAKLGAKSHPLTYSQPANPATDKPQQPPPPPQQPPGPGPVPGPGPGPGMDPAASGRTRISEARRGDAWYLLYLLMRGVVDQSYDVVRDFTSQLVEFERRVRSGNLSASATEQLHAMSTDLQLLDRRFKATVTMLRTLNRKDDGGAITDNPMGMSAANKEHFRALEEQLRGIDTEIDSLGMQASELSDLVFNMIAHRTNRSMQSLAVISTVFLPMTFIAGVYGTNFVNVPELHWQLGYMYFWLICIGVASVMVFVMVNLVR